MTQNAHDLEAFARFAANATAETIKVYRSLVTQALVLTEGVASHRSDQELIDLATEALEIAQTASLTARTIAVSQNAFEEARVDARLHPHVAIPILSEIALSCVLLFRLESLQHVLELPLSDPSEIERSAERSELASWLARFDHSLIDEIHDRRRGADPVAALPAPRSEDPYAPPDRSDPDVSLDLSSQTASPAAGVSSPVPLEPHQSATQAPEVDRGSAMDRGRRRRGVAGSDWGDLGR